MSVAKLIHARNEVHPLEDGYLYYFPTSGGGLSAMVLREIADELDRLNKPWHEELTRSLAETD